MFPTILIPAIDQPCSPGLPSPPPSLPTSHSLFPVRPLSDWSERKERLKETRAIAEGSHSCRSVCEKVFTRHFIEHEVFNEHDDASLRHIIEVFLLSATERWWIFHFWQILKHFFRWCCCKFSTRSMLFRHNLEWSMKILKHWRWSQCRFVTAYHHATRLAGWWWRQQRRKSGSDCLFSTLLWNIETDPLALEY